MLDVIQNDSLNRFQETCQPLRLETVSEAGKSLK